MTWKLLMRLYFVQLVLTVLHPEGYVRVTYVGQWSVTWTVGDVIKVDPKHLHPFLLLSICDVSWSYCRFFRFSGRSETGKCNIIFQQTLHHPHTWTLKRKICMNVDEKISIKQNIGNYCFKFTLTQLWHIAQKANTLWTKAISTIETIFPASKQQHWTCCVLMKTNKNSMFK